MINVIMPEDAFIKFMASRIKLLQQRQMLITLVKFAEAEIAAGNADTAD